MTFKPTIWYPITVVLSALNLVAVGAAAASAEPWHAGVHGALALGFAWGAQRLRRGPTESELQTPLDALEEEMSRLRQELSETQERLDFTERLLAQGLERSRVSPER